MIEMGRLFAPSPLAGEEAKRPLRRRRRAKVGMGGEARLGRSSSFHPHPRPPPSRGRGTAEQVAQSVGARPLSCTDGTPPDGRRQPLVARVRLRNRQAWRKDSAYESGSQKAGSMD